MKSSREVLSMDRVMVGGVGGGWWDCDVGDGVFGGCDPAIAVEASE